MKPFRLFVAMLVIASLSQGCRRMEHNNSLLRQSSSDGEIVAPSTSGAAPAKGKGPIGGYRPSEGS